jgi:hypothetical protein
VTIGREAPLPGTTVSINVHDTIRTTVTDIDGAFILENVPEGSYVVRAEIVGFRMVRKAKPIRVAGDDAQVVIPMKLDGTYMTYIVSVPIRVDGPSFTMSQRDADKLPLGH